MRDEPSGFSVFLGALCYLAVIALMWNASSVDKRIDALTARIEALEKAR